VCIEHSKPSTLLDNCWSTRTFQSWRTCLPAHETCHTRLRVIKFIVRQVPVEQQQARSAHASRTVTSKNCRLDSLNIIFLFATASRTVLEPTQPPIQWVLGALSLGVKRPGSEADYSPPSSAEVKNAWSYTSTPPKYVFMAWCLVKHRETLPLPIPYAI
jgi:hypothetical protein